MNKRLLKNPQQKAGAAEPEPQKNKQTPEKAGLTFAEKKRLAQLRRVLAGNSREQAKPDTAQKTITFKKMYRDGICQVADTYYTKMVEFFDINYDLLEVEDQADILEEYSKLINYFDPSIKFQLFLFNRQVSEQALAEQFDTPPQDDDFNDIREEYTQMLKHQSAKGNNGIIKSKYLIFGVESTGIKEARSKLNNIEKDVVHNLNNIGTNARGLDGKERLRILHEYFNQGTMEPFRFSFKELSESGKSVKDYIAPPGFDFRYPSRFKSGSIYGSVSYLDMIAPKFTDEMVKKLLDIDDNLTLTMHMQTIDPVEAIKMIKRALTDIQKNKIEEQKKAVRSGYDMDILPTDIVTYEKDTLELLDDLNTRAKLPKTREYALQRVFDEKTGKGKYVVVPLDKEKPFQQEGIPKTTMRRVQNEGRNFVHGKIAETEKENSAVEGAHKSEQKGEQFFSFVKRQIKGKEQKQRAKIAKLEKKQFKKEVNFQYQKFLEENPQMQKKALQKRLQKQRIKREYIKAGKKAASAKTAEQAFEKTKNGAVTVARKLQEFARKNAGLLVTVGIMALLLMTVMVSVSSCGAMFTDMQSTVLAASYLSKPKEIDAADLQLTRLELDLQKEIDRVETDNPGYDEYSYNLGAIGHNPFTLISYLSAVHTEFTAGEVESEIQALFDEMYTLTLTPDTETRTRTVTDPDTGEETEEEYEVSILRVTLTVIPLESLVSGKMETEQAEIFAMYRETNGLLQEFASPLNLYWYYYASSYYGYRKNPATGNEEFHRGVDIAVPTGTTVYAAHDGTVTAAAYDSHYGNYVAIEIDGYTTKYAHMDSISVSAGQTVEKGAVIGTTGSTGSSTGSHLHIECLYDGEYYNPLFYFDVGEGTLYGETPGGLPGNAIPPDAYDDASVQALMEEAAKYLGYPYVWGGSSPSTSFDCSGFVCWVFTNSGVHNLPRTTAQGIYDQCTPVSASDAKAGDIIFFTGTYNSAGAVSHVGIYCGNGTMIHCGDPISYASINSSYWQSHFYSFGRLN